MDINNKFCPCWSGFLPDKCCGLFLTGNEIPQKAEDLMRSRYSAFVTGNLAYLVKTTYPDLVTSDFERDLNRTLEKITWDKLEVLSTNQGQAIHKNGKVEFKAYFHTDNFVTSVHHELSTFKRLNGLWYYHSGIIY